MLLGTVSATLATTSSPWHWGNNILVWSTPQWRTGGYELQARALQDLPNDFQCGTTTASFLFLIANLAISLMARKMFRERVSWMSFTSWGFFFFLARRLCWTRILRRWFLCSEKTQLIWIFESLSFRPYLAVTKSRTTSLSCWSLAQVEWPHQPSLLCSMR